MQNPARNTQFVLTVPTLRETKLFLLSPSEKLPEIRQNEGDDNDFIFTKYHSPTSD